MVGTPELIDKARAVFDADWYLSCYRDDIPPGTDPFAHFLSVGLARGYKLRADIDPLLHRVAHPQLDGLALLEHLLAHRQQDAAPSAASRALPGIARVKRVRPAPCPVSKDREDFIRQPWLTPVAQVTFACGGRQYRLESPPASEFLERFRREEPFAIGRLSHGDWDGLALHRRYTAAVAAALPGHDWSQDQRETLAARLCEEFHNDDFGIFHEHFIPELLDDLRHLPRDPRFFHAISFKGYPTVDERLFVWEQSPATAEADRDIIEDVGRYFSPDERLLDATAWKRWLVTGALQALPDVSRRRPVVMVSQERLASLETRWQLPAFFHIAITSDAYPVRQDVLAACREALRQAIAAAEANGLGKPLCLLQGSSFAYWLMRRLFREFPDVFYIDMGQALHAWFYDDTDIELLTWGQLFAPTIVRAGRMEAYYLAQGVEAPVLDRLFGDRVPVEILEVASSARP